MKTQISFKVNKDIVNRQGFGYKIGKSWRKIIALLSK